VALADPHSNSTDPHDAHSGVVRVARVAVDGAVQADTAMVADAVAACVEAAGRPVLRVSCEDFLRPRSVRLEHGAGDPDAGYERWMDHLALRREVLDPLGPETQGEPTWLPTFWDSQTDRSTRENVRVAVPGSILIVTGPFLLRWETADAFDLSVHLQVSDAALARRLPEADRDRVTGAWQRYVEETWPAQRADLVVRFDRPSHPALVLDGAT
jgi:hypothetical protein